MIFSIGFITCIYVGISWVLVRLFDVPTLAAVEGHLKQMKALCRAHAADYDLFTTDQPLHRSLGRYLARRGSS